MSTFWELVDDAARSRPDEVVLADDFGRTLTLAAFRDQAQSVAAGLLALGVGSGDVVSWQLPTTLEAAVLMAACARLGAVQNPVIPLLREREVGFITRQVQTRLLVAPEEWRGFGHAAMGRSFGLDVLALDFAPPQTGGLRLPVGEIASLPPPPGAADICRWVYYTSGTTSDPKGARHSDRTVMAGSNGMVDQMGFNRRDVYPIAWPFAHIGGVAMLVAVIRAGGRLVLFDTWDPAATPERMAVHRPTLLGSATPFFNAYIDAQRRQGDELLYPALRACIAGGAPTPQSVNHEVREMLGVTGVVGAWGLTEFPVATSETPDDEDVGTTVGVPVRGVEVRVVDGELRLKGPQCLMGYVDAALDRYGFDEDGWFRTGDLGSVRDDGRVVIEGRLKDVILRNAENISALEVEEVILRHPDVADAAVIGIPDPRTGERVCAFVVPREARPVSLEQLSEHCGAEGLSRHKRPEVLQLVEVIPRNSMGKVLKNELRERKLRA